jgi:N-formylglutamate amidohydrolase
MRTHGRRLIGFALPVGLGLFALARVPAAGQEKPDPSALLTVRAGTRPVILSAPHGGRKPIPGVPERRGAGVNQFSTVLDTNTAELTDRLAKELEPLIGGKPWVVVARFERRGLDVNRPADGAYESEKARPLYDAYHAGLAAACKAVKAAHGRGLLLDIHGQGSFPDSVVRGTDNFKTVKLLTERFGRRAVTGKHSVLGRLEKAGYAIRPKCDSDDRENPQLKGGHIVQTYGSHTGYGIDAIQLELGSDLRHRDTYAKTADALAAAVKAFHDEYLVDPK